MHGEAYFRVVVRLRYVRPRWNTDRDSDNPGEEEGVRGNIEVEIHQTVDSDRGHGARASQAEKPRVPILAACCADCLDEDHEEQSREDQKPQGSEFAGQLQVVIMRKRKIPIDVGSLILQEGGSIGAKSGAKERISAEQLPRIAPNRRASFDRGRVV